MKKKKKKKNTFFHPSFHFEKIYLSERWNGRRKNGGRKYCEGAVQGSTHKFDAQSIYGVPRKKIAKLERLDFPLIPLIFYFLVFLSPGLREIKYCADDR